MEIFSVYNGDLAQNRGHYKLMSRRTSTVEAGVFSEQIHENCLY